MGESDSTSSLQTHPRPLPQAGGEIRAAAARLAAVSDTPRLDAELLLAHALGVTRDAMLLARLDGAVPEGFAALVKRRLMREPVAYITGRKAFWTIELEVGPSVLVPRPDSEVLIEACLDFARHEREGIWPRRVLDLGTGSGALLLAVLVEFPNATGLGIDASEAALAIAKRNAERIAPGRAELRIGDWGEGIDETFDLILCNPPYIEDAADLPRDVRDHEPHGALFAGADGLDAYRVLIPQLPSLLAPGGMIAVEIGHTQADAVQALFAEVGLSSEVRRDLGGRDRAVVHFALGKQRPSA